MTAATLAPPIAVATILNVFLFAAAWRGTQIERATGKDPWWLGLGIFLYAVLIGSYMYFTRGQPLTGYLDYFLAAIVGQSVGGVAVYSILNALYFSRGQPRANRASVFLFAAFITGLMFAGAFAS